MLERWVQEVDEETSQSRVRLQVAGSLILILAANHLYGLAGQTRIYEVAAAVGYGLFALVWRLLVWRYPGEHPLRRHAVTLIDLGFLSLGIYILGPLGAALYPLYHWLVVGNGLRFGLSALFLAAVVAVAMFAAVIALHPYWRANIEAGIGMLTGIIILSLFYAVLIKRLHLLNDRLKAELEKSEYSANHDPLTQLANRRYFMQRLGDEIQRCIRYDDSFALIYLDLNGFKQINDTWGHQEGDFLLAEVARRLKNLVRASDVAARLGGDEFGLLVNAIESREHAEEVAELIRQRLQHPCTSKAGNTIDISCSIGISCFPEDGKDIETLLREADQAMYREKNSLAKA